MTKEEIFEVIKDRLEGWELVEFLQISIERILEAFENDVIENLDDVEDLVGIKDNNKNDYDENY